jgi:Flp pilus assembly protein TadG
MWPKLNRNHRRGATAVEFALTAPIFFVFLLSAFEFGWLNVIRHTADNAAYEAARAAIVPGATVADARA